MKYRKKPVIVDAFRFVPQTDDPGDARCGPAQRWALQWNAGEDWIWHPDRVEIPTLEGTMRCDAGDWIIRGTHGEFYPCKDEIFRAIYEPTEDVS